MEIQEASHQEELEWNYHGMATGGAEVEIPAAWQHDAVVGRWFDFSNLCMGRWHDCKTGHQLIVALGFNLGQHLLG